MRIRAHLTDDVGVFKVLGDLVLGRRDLAETSTVLHRRSGTARDGIYEGRITIARGHPGTWFASVDYIDGAHKVFRTLPHEPTVLVVEPRDLTRPRTARPRAATSDIDVRTQSQSVAVSVHARDTGSGVRLVQARLHVTDDFDDFPLVTRLRLSFGTAHDGVWSGHVVVPRCGVVEGDRNIGFRAIDWSGQDSTGDGRPLYWPGCTS